MHVRHMSTADLDAVSALVGAEPARTYAIWHWNDRAGIDTDSLSADMKRAHSESFVAVSEEGGVIGYAYARVRRGALWLDRLLVPPGGNDAAAALLHAVVINYVGEPAISVAIDAEDADAHRFFQDQGFVAFDGEDDEGRQTLRRLISRA